MSTPALVPVEFPNRRSARKLGVAATRQRDGTLGYRVKKWGNGIMGDHLARWRHRDGAGHGMRNLRDRGGKTAAGKEKVR